MDAVEPIEIVVGAIPRQDRAWLQGNPVQRQYVVNLGRGQGHEGGNGTAQIQQRMRFDRRLGRAKVGLREHRQTQIDRSRVERKGHVLEIQSERLPRRVVNAGYCTLELPRSRANKKIL